MEGIIILQKDWKESQIMFFSYNEISKTFKRIRLPFFIMLILSVILVIIFQGSGSLSHNLQTGLPEPLDSTASVPGDNPILESQAVYSYDVVIYGSTPSGVMAAMAASREGLKVAIVESGNHIGGMIAGGLCKSDVGNITAVGGLAREFFFRVENYYGRDVSSGYSIEPHVAEELFLQCVDESQIDVYYECRLKKSGGVQKSGATIESITTENNLVFKGKVFIDCTYEGDLMAMSGVSYTIGREGRDEYGETLAGIRSFPYNVGVRPVPYRKDQNNFRYDLAAYSVNRGFLPGISYKDEADAGKGDKKLPAYNYRLCITDDPANQIPFARPANYDAFQYELLIQWLLLLKHSQGNRTLKMTDVFYLGDLPGNKYDLNNSGPFSSDFIGHSWDYPEADYKIRDEIANQHRDYLQGLLFFLSNNLRVPLELRVEVSRWGLAKDEFTDNDNWPYQLYIREARRMVGDFVMTQKDLVTDINKYDSVGMGSYWIDSHHVQRVFTETGLIKNEGEIQVAVAPYQMPYRILLPKETEADNLLVPVCVSASHVAYSSIRMEPEYMTLGQAAGVAAKLAIEQNCHVQDVDICVLRTLLKRQGAILELPKKP